MNSCLFFFQKLYHKCKEDEIAVYAAQASFFLLLSSVPFLFLLLTLIQYIPQVTPEDLLQFLLPLIPEHGKPLLQHIFYDLKDSTPVTIISFNSVMALWSASRGIQGMERGLNRIASEKKTQSFLKRRLLHFLHTLVLLPLCIFAILVWMFRNVSGYFRCLLAPGLFTLFFLFLYHVLPASKKRFLSKFPGAFFAALGWSLSSALLSLYFQTFQGISRLYGHFTSAAVLMLWLYFCLWLLFLGSELNQFLDSMKQKKVRI